MGFRLVPTSMTLNNLNGVIASILRYFTEFDNYAADYVKVVEDRPIMSVLAKTDELCCAVSLR